ncbi:hypothetical protein Aph01nite_57020 [Acrocarpospora phusangensis]|uniref:DUF4012 domain-containing protein n=1 Tax=Acrocarpospora phusangensis TaxID=1070424 RepID=A0A919UQY2_9ACTN|nr:DUF4012 domain-containing protein [Acrocarpospora phusangensis]GIH27392.1 hypothetical protein Aph01nite_57020 [Acrocarpospora phusangensis]
MDKRRLLAGLALIGVLPAMAVGWSAYLVLTTWHHLSATRSALAEAQGDLSSALSAARSSTGRAGPPETGKPLLNSLPDFVIALTQAREHAAAARRFTGGADWDLLSRLPLLGEEAVAVRGIARAADELTAALDELRSVVAVLRTPVAGGMPGLTGLLAKLADAGLADSVQRARLRLARARAELIVVPGDTGTGTIDVARATALKEIDRLRGWVDKLAQIVVLPSLFGREEPTRYFLAFQTNAEARGTGGLVGAFGILSAGGGKFRIRHLAANTGLENATTSVVDHGPAFLSRYGPSATQLLSNSNLSPHFPYAARTWTRLWERQTGSRLDGAIATDPVGLARLLALVGAVTLPGGEQVTAANVVDLTERAAYARYQDPVERKRFLVTIARSVGAALTERLPGPAALPVFFQLVEEGRLRVWSRHERDQARLAVTALGGALPTGRGPYAGLVVNNSGGTKLDYYLDRELHYDLGVREGDWRRSRIRLRLTNGVPEGDLPKYVTYRMDRPHDQPAIGTNRLWISLYAPVGASLQAARIDGKPTSMILETERLHPVYSKLVELGPRRSVSIELDLREPYSAAKPYVPVQPLVRPQRTTVTCAGRSCP